MKDTLSVIIIAVNTTWLSNLFISETVLPALEANAENQARPSQ
jgi:hypothetical protein